MVKTKKAISVKSKTIRKNSTDLTDTSASNENCSCPICSSDVDDDENGLICEFCMHWVHASCMEINDDAYDVYSKSKQPFFCSNCLPSAKRFLRLENRLDTMEKRFSDFEAKIIAKLDKIQSTVTSGINSNPSFASPGSTTDLIVSVVKNNLEAEAKKETAVFLNFGVDNDGDLLNNVQKLADEAGFNKDRIISARRSGPVIKRRDGTDLPRILKVTCDTPASKNELIKSINAFTKDDNAMDRIHARPDLTWAEREQARQLRKQLSEKFATGDKSYSIDYNRGMLVKRAPKLYRT
jgi:hypothetical protein